MKIKLFSHWDLDGYGCNILLKYLFSDVDCVNTNYDKINELITNFIDSEDYKNYEVIYITDISVSKEVAEKIQKIYEKGFKIQLLDHHKNLEWLNKYEWANVYYTEIVRDTISGTKLLYNNLLCNKFELTPDRLSLYSFEKDTCLEELVYLIDSYDTWKWKEEDDICPKQLNDLFFILGAEQFESGLINSYYDSFEVMEKYKFLLERKQKEIDELYKKLVNNMVIKTINCSNISMGDSKSYTAGIIFSENYASELGNRICEARDGIDFACIINMRDKRVSLRSTKEDIDVSHIASYFHLGGGIKHAAGFQIPQCDEKEAVDNIIYVNCNL